MRVKYRTLLSFTRLSRFSVCEYLKRISKVVVLSAVPKVRIDSAIAMSQRRVVTAGRVALVLHHGTLVAGTC
jgi:hypothetical protein